MRIIRKIWIPIAAVVAIGIIVLCAMFSDGVVARAATGAPNVGNFAAYSCVTQSGPIPAVRVRGKWASRDDAYFIIATPWGWPQVDASSLQIRVNNVLVNDQSRPAMANVAPIPAWDGISGHEPILSVTVSNPQPAQPFHFLM